MSAALTIDLSQLPAFANREEAVLRSLDWTPAFKQIRLLLISATKKNFAQGSSPDGEPWAPLLHPRRRSKGVDRPLRDTGLLMASVTGGSNSVDSVTPQSLIVGSNLFYAGFHQFGTRKMVARPFLGMTEDVAQKIEWICAEYLEKVLS